MPPLRLLWKLRAECVHRRLLRLDDEDGYLSLEAISEEQGMVPRNRR